MAFFSLDFDLFLTFFIDYGHIFVPKGVFWGSTSRPHIGDLVMSLIFTLGSTVHDCGWPKNGPFWTRNVQTWQASLCSKVVQKGPKRTKMVNRSIFDHLGPFWAHLDPFGPFKKMIFCSKAPLSKPAVSIWGKKIIFVCNCPKGSRWAQKGGRAGQIKY